MLKIDTFTILGILLGVSVKFFIEKILYLESFSCEVTLNFDNPIAFNVQIGVYYKVEVFSCRTAFNLQL